MYYLKIVRIQNLLFIMLIQYLISQFVLNPLLLAHGFSIDPDIFPLILLIIATVFIAAGGYVLNDYFDQKIDAINKPDQVIVGKAISRRQAMLLHQLLTAAGVVSGLWLSVVIHSTTMAFIMVVVPGLLWFYSASYKRQLIIGNVVVAFVASLSVLLVGYTEVALLQQHYSELVYNTALPREIYGWTCGFALFAFLLTWIREIIKDMQDETGDRELECRTMPIVWGRVKTLVFLTVLIAITATLLLLANRHFIQFETSLSIRYFFSGIFLPLIILMILLYRARKPEDFRSASGLAKFIMLAGLLYAPIFAWLMSEKYGFCLLQLF
jgi:4-hydroxybenzoate polyprenyltransferase